MTTIVRNVVALVDDASGRELVMRVETIDGAELIEVSNDTMSKWITGSTRAIRGSTFINWLKLQRSHGSASSLFHATERGRPTTRAARAARPDDTSDSVRFRTLQAPPVNDIPGCKLDVRVPKKASDRVQVRLDAAAVDYIKKRLIWESGEGLAKRVRHHGDALPEGCRISWSEKTKRWRALKPANAASNNKAVHSARFPVRNGTDGEKALAKQRAIDWCTEAGGDLEGESDPNESEADESEGAGAEK